MRSDSVKNMSAYADQNHAPSLTDVRLKKMLWLSWRSLCYDKSVMIVTMKVLNSYLRFKNRME